MELNAKQKGRLSREFSHPAKEKVLCLLQLLFPLSFYTYIISKILKFFKKDCFSPLETQQSSATMVLLSEDFQPSPESLILLARYADIFFSSLCYITSGD